MSNLQEILASFSLSSREAKIYLILNKYGELDVPKIVEYIGLSRTAVYEALNNLMAQDFVSYRKEGRSAYYSATHPSKLAKLKDEKEKEVGLLMNEMEETIRQLTGSYNLAHSKPGVRFYEGVEGIKDIYNEILQERGTDMYNYFSPDVVPDSLMNWIEKVFVETRAKRNISVKMITVESDYAKMAVQKDERVLRETLVLPKDKFPMEADCILYGGRKTVFLSYGEKDLIGVIIDSKAIYSTLKAAFDLNWSAAKSMK